MEPGLPQYQDDPHFQGDIILLEPGETDLAFFKMAPLMTRKEVREGLERLLRNEPSEGPEDVLLRDVPSRELRVA